jgi:hypothetical protein
MENLTAGSTTGAPTVFAPPRSVTGESPTAPEQIWRWLTPTQQHRVFQVVVQACHQLVLNCPPEVRDEQP